jgi:poly(3-hydroxybutyrate) depolymerase
MKWCTRALVSLTAGAMTMAAALGCRAEPIPTGNGEQTVSLPGADLQVFTYRPADCTATAVLLVFHGVSRDAGPYRDHAKPIADKLCAVVVSPLFDAERFPRDRYQYGGVADHGRAVPPGQRTVDLVAPLVAWAQVASGKPDLPSILVGHSAGAQFLDRVAAFTTTKAERILLANPSTWVMPNAETQVPFGFGGVAPNPEEALRAYLALPIIVNLGQADTGTKTLAMSAEAMAQGPYRLARGRNAFAAAKQAAESHGWPFGWTLIEVPDVGHSATKMFGAAETLSAFDALAPRK